MEYSNSLDLIKILAVIKICLKNEFYIILILKSFILINGIIH